MSETCLVGPVVLPTLLLASVTPDEKTDEASRLPDDSVDHYNTKQFKLQFFIWTNIIKVFTCYYSSTDALLCIGR